MADAAASLVHIGENSPEQVAYKLLHMIGQAEKKELRSVGSARVIADRKWILDTYVECLEAVSGKRIVGQPLPTQIMKAK